MERYCVLPMNICLECKNALIKKLIAAFYKYIKLRLNTRVYALSPGPDVCASSICKTVKDRDRFFVFALLPRPACGRPHPYCARTVPSNKRPKCPVRQLQPGDFMPFAIRNESPQRRGICGLTLHQWLYCC